MSASPTGSGRPGGLPPGRDRAARLYLYAARSALWDLQTAHALSDTEMLQILTHMARDLAARLPEEPPGDLPPQ